MLDLEKPKEDAGKRSAETDEDKPRNQIGTHWTLHELKPAVTSRPPDRVIPELSSLAPWLRRLCHAARPRTPALSTALHEKLIAGQRRLRGYRPHPLELR